MEELSEARFTAPRDDCPHPHYWHSVDGDATELEVTDFIYGLVRGIQPDICLETGTHLGYTARAIGRALAENGHGWLHTYEPKKEKVYAASMGATKLPITFHIAESMTPWEGVPIDFAWFDSLLPLRAKEFNFYLKYMHPRTMVAFHDAGPHHGAWSDELRTHPNLKVIDLPTPRGCLVGRVVV